MDFLSVSLLARGQPVAVSRYRSLGHEAGWPRTVTWYGRKTYTMSWWLLASVTN